MKIVLDIYLARLSFYLRDTPSIRIPLHVEGPVLIYIHFGSNSASNSLEKALVLAWQLFAENFGDSSSLLSFTFMSRS